MDFYSVYHSAINSSWPVEHIYHLTLLRHVDEELNFK